MDDRWMDGKIDNAHTHEFKLQSSSTYSQCVCVCVSSQQGRLERSVMQHYSTVGCVCVCAHVFVSKDDTIHLSSDPLMLLMRKNKPHKQCKRTLRVSADHTLLCVFVSGRMCGDKESPCGGNPAALCSPARRAKGLIKI